MTVLEAPSAIWVDVCRRDEITPNRGVCALVHGVQVAVFRVPVAGDEEFLAISNYDPFSRAFVLSRGIVGSKGDRVKVASPVYKQGFDLHTGECLDDPMVSLPTFPVRVVGDRVQVGWRATAVAGGTLS
jgi:nitrite reductase (NADH) small subunit